MTKCEWKAEHVSYSLTPELIHIFTLFTSPQLNYRMNYPAQFAVELTTINSFISLKATPNKFLVSRPQAYLHAGGQSIFHYFIIRLSAFPAIICLKQLKKVHKSMSLPFKAAKLTQT